MWTINEKAADEREKRPMANLGKIAEFGFATMGSGIRSSPGPPIYLITYRQHHLQVPGFGYQVWCISPSKNRMRKRDLVIGADSSIYNIADS
jgi:hypothetical protein